jgi:hypothetical protein
MSPLTKISSGRHADLAKQAASLRSFGLVPATLTPMLTAISRARHVEPLPLGDVELIARAAEWFSAPGPKATAATRTLFDSYEDAETAPPIGFLIEGFLQREGVSGIAAPVRERKSLIALNICHALLTGEKLFGYFPVTLRPERVVYLCPEVARGPFYSRVKSIGLLPFAGTKLLCRTLTTEGAIELDDPELRAYLPGCVIILDTAIRFLQGSENESGDVRQFAATLFGMLRDGAESVIMLHHSPKAKPGESLSLESALRGSGELGAFLACCYGTCLVDPDNPYESPSFVTNMKQRDFESDNFMLSSSPSCRMTMIRKPGRDVTMKSAGKDGKADEAKDYVRAHLGATAATIVKDLKGMGVARSPAWVAKTKLDIKDTLYEEMQKNGGKLPSSK